MVEGNMSKFESQISKFQSGGEFLVECMCTFDPSLRLALLRD
jgi:hypothetical protein